MSSPLFDLLAGTSGSFVTLLTGAALVAPNNAAPLNQPNESAPAATRLIDLDGDGALDILSQDAEGALKIRMHVGQRQFSDIAQTLPKAHVTEALSTDLNGDGTLDLYLVTPGQDLALVGDGTGRFTEATEKLGLVTTGFGLSAERIDLDGDGLQELIVHNQGSDVLFWAEANGRFAREGTTTEGSANSTQAVLVQLANQLNAEGLATANGTATSTGARRPVAPSPLSGNPALPLTASAPGTAFNIFELFVNDDANEVDTADVADGSLVGADVSTTSGDVSHSGGNVGIGTSSPNNQLDVLGDADFNGPVEMNNSGTLPALHVTGSGFFTDDGGTLHSSVGAGVRVFRESGNGHIFAYNYGSTPAGPLNLILQGPGGKIGIGTDAPATTLDIDGALTIRGGADIVERFDVTGDAVEPGTVVVIDTEKPGDLAVSTQAYDRRVAGIVSGAGGVKPGICLGQEGVMDGEVPVAMTGRVYVRASAENGAIQPGDRLTTADLAGHAMRVSDNERSVGAVIGKAMTSLDEGTGLVLVLVNLQ